MSVSSLFCYKSKFWSLSPIYKWNPLQALLNARPFDSGPNCMQQQPYYLILHVHIVLMQTVGAGSPNLNWNQGMDGGPLISMPCYIVVSWLVHKLFQVWKQDKFWFALNREWKQQTLFSVSLRFKLEILDSVKCRFSIAFESGMYVLFLHISVFKRLILLFLELGNINISSLKFGFCNFEDINGFIFYNICNWALICLGPTISEQSLYLSKQHDWIVCKNLCAP